MCGSSLSSLIWSVADLLRGDYKPAEYGRVILPLTVLRRLDCVLAPTKDTALKERAARTAMGVNPDPFLQRVTGLPFHNASPLDLPRLLGDQDHIAANMEAYVAAFPPVVRDIFERFGFEAQVERLRKAKLLYKVTERFAGFDLSPAKVTNHDMGLVFEELIRRFADLSNETAGEHFTPRDAIELMVSLLFIEDDEVLTPGNQVIRTLYDCTAGTGGMLSTGEEFVVAHNSDAKVVLFGQELNDESYAICKADMLIKGQDIANVVSGNTLSEDGHAGRTFDYMLANPPYGTNWKKVQAEVTREYEQRGFAGRFGPGLPPVSDGQTLFLLHLVSKMRPAQEGGSRIGIVLNGSPLFAGGAGSGTSEIRRHLLENDLVEAVVALPTDMFFNTGIATYVWLLTNRKPAHRKGLVQLIDASALWEKMRRSLGSKRRRMSGEHIKAVTQVFHAALPARLATLTDAAGRVSQAVVTEGEAEPQAPEGGTLRLAPLSLLLPNEAFGYRTITVERPMRDVDGQPAPAQKKAKGKPMPDPALRDTENVPLLEDPAAYFEREIRPHVPDAWVDEGRTRVGYEIPFNRHFYVFEPPRPLEEIDADLKASTDRIRAMLDGLAA